MQFSLDVRFLRDTAGKAGDSIGLMWAPRAGASCGDFRDAIRVFNEPFSSAAWARRGQTHESLALPRGIEHRR